mmetsp:Transcript_11633/g.20218  ORF Transcript_11633/g.20218 Transcript_11633/m.20218 type:complete len:361 (-) Transcript_11633:331-1413(-)
MSDPAASASSSTGSNNDDPAAATGNSFDQSQRSDPASPTRDSNGTSQVRASDTPSEEERIAELRAILPDASIEELREILRENDRASGIARQSANDGRMAEAFANATESVESSRPSVSGGSSSRYSTASRGSRRRSWQPCQPAPSRPGIFRVGGPIETGGNYDVGATDEVELQIRRIEAVSSVQEALKDKLGYDLRESGQYEQMEREFKEGEEMLASTGLGRTEKNILPAMMMWEAPPVSRQSMMKKEPAMPELGEPMCLPMSFGCEEGMQNAGNSEICLGKFVDPGPDREEDEQKREEDTVGNESWDDKVSVDSAPMGPDEHVVRCWKCRAGLKVHIEVGLVACPRCKTVSPATEIANIF